MIRAIAAYTTTGGKKGRGVTRESWRTTTITLRSSPISPLSARRVRFVGIAIRRGGTFNHRPDSEVGTDSAKETHHVRSQVHHQEADRRRGRPDGRSGQRCPGVAVVVLGV